MNFKTPPLGIGNIYRRSYSGTVVDCMCMSVSVSPSGGASGLLVSEKYGEIRVNENSEEFANYALVSKRVIKSADFAPGSLYSGPVTPQYEAKARAKASEKAKKEAAEAARKAAAAIKKNGE